MEYQPKHKTKLKELSLELPKDYQTVSCPSCATLVPASNLYIPEKVGKCEGCDLGY